MGKARPEACGASGSAHTVHSSKAQHKSARQWRMQCTAAISAAVTCRAGHTGQGFGRAAPFVSEGSAPAIQADTDGRRRQGARRETTQHCFVRRQRYLNLDELLPGPNTGNTELRKLRHMDSGFTCAGQRCLPSAGQHLETRMSRHTPVDRARTQACLSIAKSCSARGSARLTRRQRLAPQSL